MNTFSNPAPGYFFTCTYSVCAHGSSSIYKRVSHYFNIIKIKMIIKMIITQALKYGMAAESYSAFYQPTLSVSSGRGINTRNILTLRTADVQDLTGRLQVYTGGLLLFENTTAIRKFRRQRLRRQ
jgi:hypothetical protein